MGEGCDSDRLALALGLDEPEQIAFADPGKEVGYPCARGVDSPEVEGTTAVEVGCSAYAEEPVCRTFPPCNGGRIGFGIDGLHSGRYDGALNDV